MGPAWATYFYQGPIWDLSGHLCRVLPIWDPFCHFVELTEVFRSLFHCELEMSCSKSEYTEGMSQHFKVFLIKQTFLI